MVYEGRILENSYGMARGKVQIIIDNGYLFLSGRSLPKLYRFALCSILAILFLASFAASQILIFSDTGIDRNLEGNLSDLRHIQSGPTAPTTILLPVVLGKLSLLGLIGILLPLGGLAIFFTFLYRQFTYYLGFFFPICQIRIAPLSIHSIQLDNELAVAIQVKNIRSTLDKFAITSDCRLYFWLALRSFDKVSRIAEFSGAEADERGPKMLRVIFLNEECIVSEMGVRGSKHPKLAERILGLYLVEIAGICKAGLDSDPEQSPSCWISIADLGEKGSETLDRILRSYDAGVESLERSCVQLLGERKSGTSRNYLKEDGDREWHIAVTPKLMLKLSIRRGLTKYHVDIAVLDKTGKLSTQFLLMVIEALFARNDL